MNELERERGLIAQFFFEQARLKLLALGCSIALCIFDRSLREAERIIDWPLVAETSTAGPDLVPTSVVRTSVRVTLRGPRTRLGALDAGALTPIRVDLTRSERPDIVLLEKTMIPATAPLEVVGIEPRRLQLGRVARVQAAGGRSRASDGSLAPLE